MTYSQVAIQIRTHQVVAIKDAVDKSTYAPRLFFQDEWCGQENKRQQWLDRYLMLFPSRCQMIEYC